MDKKKAANMSQVNEPIVCAYACIPEFPDGIQSHYEQYISSSSDKKPNVEIDIDKVQEIAISIKQNKKKLYDIENLLLAPKDQIMVESLDTSRNETLICVEYDSELAKCIIELIKSHYENEIERLNKELITVVVG